MPKIEDTISSMIKIWIGYNGRIGPQQLTDLFNTTGFILEHYSQDGKYLEEREFLKKLFFDPIETLKDKYPDLKISKNHVEWDISKIEMCYYEDIIRSRKLSHNHYTDTRKIKETKQLYFGEIVTIVSLFKSELHRILNKVILENEINLTFDFVNAKKEIKQLGGGDIV